MNKVLCITLLIAAAFIPSLAQADLSYNQERDEAIENLHAVESASINMHYQCGKHALIISAFATESEVNGPLATITGKIISKEAVHDISKDLSSAISKHNILAGEMTVACNADKGAFQIIFTPNRYDTRRYGPTVISVFADGHVDGTRVRKTQPLP